ncbi:hypothetical protein C7H19_23685 [Aphanothece hegewaldii CCALA 016]|uniref:Uncharacterized protein n=1 Tax=Aphanothece hegewaldii CCALA 016 TaxID=2107694 RepID=A0A2T1LR48_9CHRO|nr:hypothetical protein [Aphanothece hegewaldii]PSF30586.1 hypothetical protein C7H19_23685 [Aphanothece hegewaldii CCALA 016]
MALYKGVYVSDCGKSFPNTILTTYTYNISTRTKSDTAYEFDNEYLPNVFKQNTELGGVGCRLDVLKLRFAQLWLNDNEYLAVELPFKPSSLDFNSFFIELAFYGKQTTLGLSGETMNFGYLSLFLNQ